ncbi:hypothetical protein SDJN02_26847, partial [Cucurbita argyrosperma subsp. argyrosperma]
MAESVGSASLLHVLVQVPLVGKKILFTLAAATSSNSSRTFKWVWDNGVISLGVLRKSRSSYIWRLCRVLEGLSLDYG